MAVPLAIYEQSVTWRILLLERNLIPWEGFVGYVSFLGIYCECSVLF